MSPFAGIVLCGGRSRRMGRPKHLLPFGSECLLQRVVRRLQEAVEQVVVVGSPTMELPSLPARVKTVYDRAADRGPLEGLHVGLSALPPETIAAFVIGCDVPGLVPAFVTRMLAFLGEHAIAVPQSDGCLQPLTAVYRCEVGATAAALLDRGERCPLALFDLLPTRIVPAAELRAVDPTLATLQNVNHQADYLAALTREGFDADQGRATAADR